MVIQPTSLTSLCKTNIYIKNFKIYARKHVLLAFSIAKSKVSYIILHTNFNSFTVGEDKEREGQVINQRLEVKTMSKNLVLLLILSLLTLYFKVEIV